MPRLIVHQNESNFVSFSFGRRNPGGLSTKEVNEISSFHIALIREGFY